MYIFSLQKGDGSLCVAIQCMTYTKAAVIAQETWGSIIPQVDLLLVVSWGYSKSAQFGDNFWSKGRRRSNQTIWYSPAFSCIKPSVLVSTELVFAPSSGMSSLVTWWAGGGCLEELILAQLLTRPTLIHLSTLRLPN